MFKPKYKITNTITNLLTDIADARAVILNASLIPKWEIDLRKEALIRSTHASTSIEGNRLSLEEVSDLMLGRKITATYKDKQEVLNYFEALSYLDNFLPEKKKKLANEDVLELHRIVTKDVLDDPRNCGKYRSGTQYVVVGNRYTGEITFRPPTTKIVPKLMQDLINWINQDKGENIYPVLEAGIVHYEFVRIHPFIDGNGRTARTLSTLILVRRGFDTKRFFALDDFYNSDRSRYYKVLKNVNQVSLDITEWLEYFCEGVNICTQAVKNKVLALTDIQKKHKGKKQIEVSDKQIKILELIKKQGKITNKDIQQLLHISNKTAYITLELLLKHKLIKKIGEGRSVFYVLI
jgi:Fic family protein